MGNSLNGDRCESIVRDIMLEFAESTGLSPAAQEPRRYLWTDAFALCNFLELWRCTGEEIYKDMALCLVDQVHFILGRHREGDPRTGWISGLDEEEGKRHPTKGGLRIGKKLNERRPGEPFDDRLEWDRDGQYYHYLTKWMHALNRVSSATGDPRYNRWAVELAKAAHAGFTYAPSPGETKCMHWKMSIDLSHPLVPSMGHHDPLDGLITYSQLQAALNKDPEEPERLDLNNEIADMARICEGQDWATDDPLGIGGLLCDALKAAHLMATRNSVQRELVEMLLQSALQGMSYYERGNPLKLPSEYRLAFRELGLSIGLHAVERLRGLAEENAALFREEPLASRIDALMQHTPMAELIESYWLKPGNRRASTWRDHLDINRVMLATSLAPDGFLGSVHKRHLSRDAGVGRPV